MKRDAAPIWAVLLTVALALVVHAHAGEPTWVGKIVILKNSAVKIGYTDADGRQVYVATLNGLDYPVREEQDGWVLVPSAFGAEGWLDKDNAVLLDDAEAYFTTRLRQYPEDADACNRRGWSRKLNGALDKAIEDFSAALRLAPDAAVFNNRATVWYDQGNYDRAIQDCNEALRLAPKYSLAFNNRGNAWSAQKAYDKAIADYDEALRLEPKYAAALNNRGNARACQKEYDAAIRDYNEAIRLEPKFAAAFSNRGHAWAFKNDYLKAFRDYSQAARLEPRLGRAQNSRQTGTPTTSYDRVLDWMANLGEELSAQTGRLNEWLRQIRADENRHRKVLPVPAP